MKKRLVGVDKLKNIMLLFLILVFTVTGLFGCGKKAEESDKKITGPFTEKLKQFEDFMVADDTVAAQKAREEELRRRQEQAPGFFEVNQIAYAGSEDAPFVLDTYTGKGNKIKVRVSFDKVKEFKSEEGYQMMEGYRWVQITRRATVEDEYWPVCEEDGSWYLRGLVYDFYSGKKIPYEAVSVYDKQTVQKKVTTTIKFKNLNRDIVARKEVSYTADKKTMVTIYTLQIPLDYDGIMVLTAPQLDGEVDVVDDRSDSLDLLDVDETYHFVRFE